VGDEHLAVLFKSTGVAITRENFSEICFWSFIVSQNF
jgi:hypothetical protein